jgi:F-type H+-transporting ATPase subunit delta
MASVAGTYARAFVDVVADKRLDITHALQELRAVSALMKENDELRRVWENPSIPGEQKRRVLDALAAREGFSQTVRNFVAVVIDHHRIPFFEQIVAEVEKEMDVRMGVAEAQISSARELSEGEKRELEGQVARLTGKRVRATYSRDTSLLGGAVVRVGSTIYDGSVLGQLQRMREQIAGGAAFSS